MFFEVLYGVLNNRYNIKMLLQVGVKVLLKNPDSKILIVERSAEKYGNIEGSWDSVGGRINPGSILLENLSREVKEETQLEILNTPVLIAAQDIILLSDRHIVRLTYTAFTIGEPILDTSENVAYRWLSFEELSKESKLDKYLYQLIQTGILRDSSWKT